MSIITGLVSVTFRKLPPARIITLARQANLDTIEWGADVHVPVGNLNVARETGRLTREAGLDPLSYGSYYVAGAHKTPFAQVLETAATLGAINIRVWAGKKGSKESDESERQQVIDDLRTIATLSEKAGLTVSLERHGETLTDTPASALRLFQELNERNIHAYWQPAVDLSHQEALAELQTLMPWLSSVHVFCWAAATTDRLPLLDGLHDWQQYLAVLASSRQKHPALLEFVQDDSEEAFLRDARTLHEILKRVHSSAHTG